jgi:hypothetical protein
MRSTQVVDNTRYKIQIKNNYLFQHVWFQA